MKILAVQPEAGDRNVVESLQKSAFRKMKKAETIVSLGTTALGLNPVTADVKLIIVTLRKLSAMKRQELLNRLDSHLKGNAKRRERDRIAAARLLVACLPDSMSVIQRWIATNSGRWSYEIHFSLFCFLGDAQLLGLDRNLIQALIRSVSEYLLSMPRNRAKAVWMAGDLLGDHWKGREALTALLDIARNAHYVAGRSAAIHGLERRFRRSDQRDPALILRALRDTVSRDRSRKLRQRVSRVVKRLAVQ